MAAAFAWPAAASALDTTAPAVYFRAPAPNAILRGTAASEAVASDNVGIARVRFYIDGVLKHTEYSAPYTFSFDSRAYASGAHMLAAMAVDTSGNSKTAYVGVNFANGTDTQAPSVTILSPANGAIVSGVVNSQVNATDNVGIAKVEFAIDNTLKQTDQYAPYTFSFDSRAYANGTHMLVARAFDKNGLATYKTINFTIRNTSASPTPSPRPSATPSPIVTTSPRPSATPSPIVTTSPRPSATPSPIVTTSPRPSATPSPIVTTSPRPSATPSPIVTPSPAPSASSIPGAFNPRRIFYVDYVSGSDSNAGTTKSAPWKRAPGMTGFAAAYTHQEGDAFIFKGGVTWPSAALPLTIRYSGSASYHDYYTTDHTWFSGTSWSQPVLNGGNAVANAIVAASKSYFELNDLKVSGVGAPQTANGKKAVDIGECAQFKITNMTVAPESWIGLYLHSTLPATTRTDIVIAGNNISNAGMAVVVAGQYDGVDIYKNRIHDLASQVGGGVHGDGIHVWGDSSNDSVQVKNLRIHDNLFYGDFHRSFGTSGGMTGLIFIENATESSLIYNNAMSYTDYGTTQFEGLIVLTGNPNRGGYHRVYNNTLKGTSPGMSAGMVLGDGVYGAEYTEVRNNIISGMQYAYLTSGSGTYPTLKIDYNLVSATSAVGDFKSWSQWQALGFDTHGVNANPQFVSSTDLHLGSGSPAIDRGYDLSNIFQTDQEGTDRHLYTPWDIGAFEFRR